MNHIDILAFLRREAFNSYGAKRIISQLLYLQKYSAVNKRNGLKDYEEDISRVIEELYQAYLKEGAVINEAAKKAEEQLLHISPEIKKYHIMLAGHAHIDMNWMWGYQETAALAVDTFRTVLELMKEYPQFTFSQSQASTYKIIEEYAPEMIDEIKKRIHEGRWEPTASQWVEADKNMPSGESMTRHILYTKRYLSKLFDIDPDTLNIDFEPDTFGHSTNVPEILASGGVKYYYFSRSWEGSHMIRWRSPSGAEILAYRDHYAYNDIISTETFLFAPEYYEKYGIDVLLKVYGIGDHGGGPTRRDIEMLTDMATWPLFPTLEFSTFGKYFKELERYRESFPIEDHDLNYIFTGCYASQSRIKAMNRKCEERMYESEMLSAAAGLITDETKREFKKAWEKVLFNQFHDILTGSGVEQTREYAMGEGQKALAEAGVYASSAIRRICAAIDTSDIIQVEPYGEYNDKHSMSEGAGVGFGFTNEEGSQTDTRYEFSQTERGRGRVRIFTLFNTTGFDRDCVTEITVWDYEGDWTKAYFKDADGKQCPHQLLIKDKSYWHHKHTKIALKVNIPALSYATYVLSEIEDAKLDPTVPYGNWFCDYIDNSDFVLENNKIKAVFDCKTIRLTEMTDKQSGQKTVDGLPCCSLRYIKENDNKGMTSWRTGRYMSVVDMNESCDVKLLEYNTDGLKKWIKYTMAYESSTFTVTVNLYENSSVLDFMIKADWHEIGKAGEFIPQLNFFVPVGYNCGEYMYDIQFGTKIREPISHDVPAMSVMSALNENGKSMYLVTDSKYAYRGYENAMSTTLLRSSMDPDLYPENGISNIRVGVGIVEDNEPLTLIKAANEFNHSIYFSSNTMHKGTLPKSGEMLHIESGNAVISAIKAGEEGGIAVRMYNPQSEATIAKIAIGSMSRAHITDVNETADKGNIENKDGTASVSIGAHASTTVLIDRID